jgi:hypothetical protein
MGKSAPTPPPPPDPSIAIAEQGRQQRINVISPFGTTRFTGAGGEPISDITRTDVLDPSQQRQFDIRNRLGEALLGQAETQVGQFDVSPFEFRGAETGQNVTFNRQAQLLQPEFEKQEERLRQNLSNQGIPIGSELFDERLQKLRDDQGRTLSGLASQTDVTGFAQAVSTRQQRFNELAALLGGQQLTPQNVQTQPINVQGAFNAQQAAQQSAFEAQQQQSSDFQSGLFSLGSAAIMASDRRLKKNIKRIGTHVLGIGVYLFDYLWGETAIGVMADEVKTVMPEAVIKHPSGYDMVNYDMIGGAYG